MLQSPAFTSAKTFHKKSPMEVTMENAVNNQIHVSQSVPMSSPLTWKLTGDIESNQFEVRQNAADSNSPLDCSPECPQEEYVYDYQYADSAAAGHGNENTNNNIEDYIIEDEYDYDVVDANNEIEPVVLPQ